MADEAGEYADRVTLTYMPAEYGGATRDADRWVDVDLPAGYWDVTWLDGLIDGALHEVEVAGFHRETRAMHTSWGASGAAMEITIAVAESGFASLVTLAARQVVAAVRERFRTPPAPVPVDVLIDQARQRVAIRHGVFADDLRIVDVLDGTDILKVTFAAGDGTLYEVEVDPREPWIQTVRRQTRSLAE